MHTEKIEKDWHCERMPYPLKLKWLRHERLWRLTDDFVYIDERGRKVICTAEYVTDLGTVPRLLRPFLSVVEWAEAFVVHDWFCDGHGWADGSSGTRKQGDRLLREIAIFTGHSRWKAQVVYALVRSYAVVAGKDN